MEIFSPKMMGEEIASAMEHDLRDQRFATAVAGALQDEFEGCYSYMGRQIYIALSEHYVHAQAVENIDTEVAVFVLEQAMTRTKLALISLVKQGVRAELAERGYELVRVQDA